MKRRSIISLGIVGLLVLLYIGVGMYYQDRFLPRTQVGQVDISGDKVAEAERKLAKNLHAQSLSVTEGGQTLAEFTPSDLAASVATKDLLRAAKDDQGFWNWPLRLFTDNAIQADGSGIAYDETKMDALLDSLPLTEKGRTAVQNATIVNEKGQFKIQPEVLGTMVDRAELQRAIIQAMMEGKETVALEDSYQKPTLTKEDANLQQAVTQLEQLAGTEIVYEFAGVKEIVPRELIAAWLTVDAKGKPSVDQEAAKAYLETLDQKHGTHTKARSFESTSRGTVEVPAGTYGWSIATTTEAENLTQYILSGEDRTVMPAINGSGYHADGTDVGSTYIEVDIENQMMYLYKEGEKRLETNIVSGHPQTASPIGVFYAWDKVEDTFLVGYNPRRAADYETPVDYWVPVNWDGIGIHDADWQVSFASDAYLTEGSNGCINTPPGVMADFFAEIEPGMPVIIF